MKKTSFAQILGDAERELQRRADEKLPDWAGKKVRIPDSLALQQCSSSATAEYKRTLVAERMDTPLPDICDITGGLGVDSMALAAVCKRLHYYERKEELAAAARENAEKLGIDNIVFNCGEIGPDSELPDCSLIYADPARRDGIGRKVAALSDCSPDINALLPMLFHHTERVMLKLSPMLDISELRRNFGEMLDELHIVSLKGEVRELLCLLSSSNKESGCRHFMVELQPGIAAQQTVASRVCRLQYNPAEKTSCEIRLAGQLAAGQFLIEPRAALLKAGLFKWPCARFGWSKLDVSTHLYVSDHAPDTAIAPFVKNFRIIAVFPLDKSGMRECGRAYPRADVSAHNIPMNSEQLRQRLTCRSDSSFHVFGCTHQGKRILVAAQRMP